MTVAAAKRQEIIERQMKVSSLRLSGYRRQDKIADELGVSHATINRDFKALDLLYQERAATNIATAKGIDLERLDELILAIWTRAKGGSLDAIDAVRALMAARSKLLGLDAPSKLEHAGPDGGPIPLMAKEMTDDELRAIIAKG